MIRKDFKYKKIKNFLTSDELILLKDYCIIKHRANEIGFDVNQTQGETFIYGDPVMESLLLKKRKKMEEITGLKLLPTYAFWRMYIYLSNLKKHKDRPSCEISVTINLGNDGTSWPIFMDGTPIEVDPGDAAVYLGQTVEHWREPFEGDFQAQAFLHYVNFNGPHTSYYKDRRHIWGIPKNN